VTCRAGGATESVVKPVV